MRYAVALFALLLFAADSQAFGRTNAFNRGFARGAAFANHGFDRGYYGFSRGFGGYYGGSFGVYGAGYYGGAYNSFGLYGAAYVPPPPLGLGYNLAGYGGQSVQVNETEVKSDGGVIYRTYNMVR